MIKQIIYTSVRLLHLLSWMYILSECMYLIFLYIFP